MFKSENAIPTRFDLLNTRTKGSGRGKRKVVKARAILSGDARKIADRINNSIFFDIILHRPVPKQTIIKYAQIIRQRNGKRFDYFVCFNCSLPERSPATIDTEVVIGIDTGWRILQELKYETKDSLRQYAPVQIAAIAFSDGRNAFAEIHFPESLAQKASDLVRKQSELDKSATEFGKGALPLIGGLTIPENYPGKDHEVKSKIRFLNGLKTIDEGSKSIRKNSKLVIHYSTYRELHGFRRHITAERNEIYRNVAADLVKPCNRNLPELSQIEDGKLHMIAVENLSLPKMAARKFEYNALSNRALALRQLVAPGAFLDAVKNAAEREGIPFLKIDPRLTSKTCSKLGCGKVNDVKAEKIWRCEECNTEHDRDRNAAINIARLGIKEWKKQ